ncbi:MAG: YitT family protein [Bacteroidales bacterium]|nr:YitT family protein [Bacteroidales bacterium]
MTIKAIKERVYLEAKDYVMIVVGLIIYSFGFCAFILPQKVVIGGYTGLASLFYYTLGIPVGPVIFAFNFISLAMAYKIVGRRFVMRSIFGAFGLSACVSIMQPLFPEAIVAPDNPMMNVIIGGVLCGMGLGLAFVHNGSSGGTDIIAAMVNKRTNVSIGRMLLYADGAIIFSSMFLFHSIDNVVYGFLELLFATFMTDQVINTNRQAMQFLIISDKWEEIANAIVNDAHRGCTVFDGVGWFTKDEVKMLMVMCRKIEGVTVMRVVKSIDPYAFITQSNVNGVYGVGFDAMKIRLKNFHPNTDHNLVAKRFGENEFQKKD